MQIRVQCRCGESSCPEWAVVELQGVVQPQASFAGDIRGLHIGRLCSAPSPSSSSKEGYTFTVGYHELAGTKVTLKKPLLVLRKKTTNAGCGEQEPPEVELEVMGIIDPLQRPPQGPHLKAANQGDEGRAASSKVRARQQLHDP